MRRKFQLSSSKWVVTGRGSALGIDDGLRLLATGTVRRVPLLSAATVVFLIPGLFPSFAGLLIGQGLGILHKLEEGRASILPELLPTFTRVKARSLVAGHEAFVGDLLGYGFKGLAAGDHVGVEVALGLEYFDVDESFVVDLLEVLLSEVLVGKDDLFARHVRGGVNHGVHAV
jgi:hypothetical protein